MGFVEKEGERKRRKNRKGVAKLIVSCFRWVGGVGRGSVADRQDFEEFSGELLTLKLILMASPVSLLRMYQLWLRVFGVLLVGGGISGRKKTLSV